MTNKLRHESASPEIPSEGAFRQISGIGPGIEQRLHSAGIHTFAQLGELSIEEILAVLNGMVGITRERVTQQDWPAQARRLAQELQPLAEAGDRPQLPQENFRSEPPPETEPENDWRKYESFMVELLIDENHQVRRTRVVHVRSNEKSSWAGWNPHHLDKWVAKQLHLSQPQELDDLSSTRVNGSVTIRSLSIFPLAADSSTHFIDSYQPFHVHILLDLSQASVRPNMGLVYQAAVEAHPLGSGRSFHLGSNSGPLSHSNESEQAILSIKTNGIPEGTYRLEATVLVYSEGSLSPEQDGARAMIEGELLQVFASVPIYH